MTARQFLQFLVLCAAALIGPAAHPQVDFSAPAYRDTDATVVASSSPDQVVIYHYDLTRSFFRASWMGRLVEDGSVKKFSISKADSGYLREGLNTFEVFADLDGDGQYTVGEPVGIARNVNVGWDMVPEVFSIFCSTTSLPAIRIMP